jgi:leucyl/phenylalanyl-tRNA---protein transferase
MSRGFGPDELLACYARGVFPMADGRDDPRLFLVDPDERGVLPLEGFHVPSRLARTMRRAPYEVRVDTAFDAVVAACAAPAPDRPETWINDTILGLYGALHRRGAAHSVECWHDGNLVGGLYGVRLGAAFFGESMFSTADDASKIALVHLVALLIAGGFTLLDTQFTTAHLAQFGVRSLARATYRQSLDMALGGTGVWPGRAPTSPAGPPQAQSLGLRLGPVELSRWLEAQTGPGLHSAPEPQAALEHHPGRRLAQQCLRAIADRALPRHRPRSE